MKDQAGLLLIVERSVTKFEATFVAKFVTNKNFVEWSAEDRSRSLADQPTQRYRKSATCHSRPLQIRLIPNVQLVELNRLLTVADQPKFGVPF